MRKRQLVTNLAVIADSQLCTLFRKGVPLSGRDQETVRDVYSMWICILLDLGYLSPLTLKRDSTRLLNDMFKRDVYDLIKSSAELLQMIYLKNSSGFKGHCSAISTHLYPLIKDDKSKCMGGDVLAARRLIQLFGFMNRLSLQDIDLTQQCLEDYLANENYINSQYPIPLVNRLNSIVQGWLRSFEPKNLLFQHGPGSIGDSTKPTLEVKYSLLDSDALVRYVFKTYEPHLSASKQSRTSRTKFVPKSYKTFRTISMEPSTLQYLQQGVWREIDRIVYSNPFLRNHIGFRDQERNRQLALKGSISRDYATLDLSAASDLVSYKLVKGIFRKTKLLPYLMASRSRLTKLPDGMTLKLKKFAPMGSALCFPIETLIFASVCQLVTEDHGIPGDYSVYGDDLIVPTQCVRDVANVLFALGFRLNREKSYYSRDCWFRESCGIEAICGIDVTPMRISRKYKSDTRSIEYSSLVDLANEAFGRRLFFLRSFYLMKLLSIAPFVLFSDVHLHGDEMTNYHLPVRWNFRLQRLEVRTKVLKPKQEEGDESLRLRHWFETVEKRNLTTRTMRPKDWFRLRSPFAIEPFSPKIGSIRHGLEAVWTQKPYHFSDQEKVELWALVYTVLFPCLLAFLQMERSRTS